MPNLLDLIRGRRSVLDDLPAEPQGVRPDYGLRGAQISPQKSPYEPTLAPGETRSREDLQSMLWAVIEAAGMEAVPGVGPRKLERRAPARVRKTSAPPAAETEPPKPKPEAWSNASDPLPHLPGQYVSASGNKMHEFQVRMLEEKNGFVVDKTDAGFKIIDPANGRSWKYNSITRAISDFGFGGD
jgi:hypothetical protein